MASRVYSDKDKAAIKDAIDKKKHVGKKVKAYENAYDKVKSARGAKKSKGYAKGGLVRGAGKAKKGVRPCKMH